jgi:hypothetical protein
MKIKELLNLISFKKMSIDQKITLINIIIHNSVRHKMNIVTFPQSWLEQIDRIIASKCIKLLNISDNKPNKEAM